MKLPKSLIKKYGISKKTWRVFKSGSYKGKPPKARSGSGLKKSKITRGGNMARRRKGSYRRKSQKGFMGMDMPTIWMGVGSGTAGLIGGLANQLVPQIGGNIAQGLAGVMISKMGRGAIRQVGKGILIKSIGDLVEENIVPAIMGSSILGGDSTSNAGALF